MMPRVSSYVFILPGALAAVAIGKLREKINWFKENTTNEISVTEASV